MSALRCTLKRKEQLLAESRALLTLSMEAKGLMLGGRGRLHGPDLRRRVCRLVDAAMADGARLEAACRILGISRRTVLRWRKPEGDQDGRAEAERRPANRIGDPQRRLILQLLHSPSFQGLSPRQLVPRLADLGFYIASESTMYRLLRSHRREQGRAGHPARKTPIQELSVSAPNQLWSWDITGLRSSTRGTFFYLYLVMDVFSRRIMGWQIHCEENAEHAARFIRGVCVENNVEPAGIVLHSDNGRPMKGFAMLSALWQLGIVPSFSRPRVSNDNPHVEALFSTLKRHRKYPSTAFCSLEVARTWMAQFASWYNREHLHRSLSYLSPDDRYFGREESVLARRRAVYEQAQRRLPSRWSSGVRLWLLPDVSARILVRPRSFGVWKMHTARAGRRSRSWDER